MRSDRIRPKSMTDGDTTIRLVTTADSRQYHRPSHSIKTPVRSSWCVRVFRFRPENCKSSQRVLDFGLIPFAAIARYACDGVICQG